MRQMFLFGCFHGERLSHDDPSSSLTPQFPFSFSLLFVLPDNPSQNQKLDPSSISWSVDFPKFCFTISLDLETNEASVSTSHPRPRRDEFFRATWNFETGKGGAARGLAC